MILRYSWDYLSGRVIAQMLAHQTITGWPQQGTLSQKRGSLFKNIDGSTESCFPCLLPLATMINDQNFYTFVLFQRNSCHTWDSFWSSKKSHRGWWLSYLFPFISSLSSDMGQSDLDFPLQMKSRDRKGICGRHSWETPRIPALICWYLLNTRLLLLTDEDIEVPEHKLLCSLRTLNGVHLCKCTWVCVHACTCVCLYLYKCICVCFCVYVWDV